MERIKNKRLFSLILVLALVLAMTPSALAQEAMSYEEYFSEEREWSYDYSGMVTEDLSHKNLRGKQIGSHLWLSIGRYISPESAVLRK